MAKRVDIRMDIGGRSVYVGTACFSARGAAVSTRFQYADSYLAREGAYEIDPALPLVSRPTIIDGLPGAFRDSAPDAWGRNLIAREYRSLALGAQSPPLNDSDYLLRSDDFSRMGNLRYMVAGEFVDQGHHIPALVNLPDLLVQAQRVVQDYEALDAIKALLNAGSNTLGGARPKASVQDGTRLMIAKFPSPTDTTSVIKWEKVTLELAAKAGIWIPKNRIISIANQDVLLQRRFDRDEDRRIGYISAMTMLEAKTGSVVDYADFPDYISANCTQVNLQLEQMWRRTAFSVLTNNTDDHLRNHGFLRNNRSWELSPAFDINPTPIPNQPRQTPILGQVAGADQMAAVWKLAPIYRISEPRAKEIIAEILAATEGWETSARSNGVPTMELAQYAIAFEQYRSAAAALLD